MRSHALLFPAGVLLVVAMAADSPPVGWRKQVVTQEFLTEGLSAGDLDGDRVIDLVAGAFWFKGPDFKEAKAFRRGRAMPTTAYQEDSFLSWVDDVNGDGRNDILMASHPGRDLTLYVNPGNAGGEWPAHRVMTEAATESPLWVDVDRDGKKELVCMQGGRFGYAEVDWADVTRPWKFVAVSGVRAQTPYIHGLGVGDLNGDGRLDIVEKDGWFAQPAEAGAAWEWHATRFSEPGGAQMLVFDVEGDGDNDIVTSLHAHAYGVAWFENEPEGGKPVFKKHEILPEDPARKSVQGLQFSQHHALEKGDFDGDGRMDFITGKRYYAHNGKDPGAEDPAVAVIFYNRKDGDGVKWQSEVIDTDSGVGCQVLAIDVDGDGRLDFAAGNKKGVHVIRR